MLAVAHHREQSRSNTCVPACACIVLSWLGKPVEEDALRRDWAADPRGYALGDAARAIGGTRMTIYPDQASFHDNIRARLVEPRWIIALVFSVPMMRFAQEMTPSPKSRFGPLARAPYGELHAVVLVGVDSQGFEYLDPYYPVAGQPFRLSNEQLAEAWQGAMVIAPSREF